MVLKRESRKVCTVMVPASPVCKKSRKRQRLSLYWLNPSFQGAKKSTRRSIPETTTPYNRMWRSNAGNKPTGVLSAETLSTVTIR
jgi:hypothetical protein